MPLLKPLLSTDLDIQYALSKNGQFFKIDSTRSPPERTHLFTISGISSHLSLDLTSLSNHVYFANGAKSDKIWLIDETKPNAIEISPEEYRLRMNPPSSEIYNFLSQRKAYSQILATLASLMSETSGDNLRKLEELCPTYANDHISYYDNILKNNQDFEQTPMKHQCVKYIPMIKTILGDLVGVTLIQKACSAFSTEIANKLDETWSTMLNKMIEVDKKIQSDWETEFTKDDFLNNWTAKKPITNCKKKLRII